MIWNFDIRICLGFKISNFGFHLIVGAGSLTPGDARGGNPGGSIWFGCRFPRG